MLSVQRAQRGAVFPPPGARASLMGLFMFCCHHQIPHREFWEHCILARSTCLYSKQVSRMIQRKEWKCVSNTFGTIQRYLSSKGLTSVTYFPDCEPSCSSFWLLEWRQSFYLSLLNTSLWGGGAISLACVLTLNFGHCGRQNPRMPRLAPPQGSWHPECTYLVSVIQSNTNPGTAVGNFTDVVKVPNQLALR